MSGEQMATWCLRPDASGTRLRRVGHWRSRAQDANEMLLAHGMDLTWSSSLMLYIINDVAIVIKLVKMTEGKTAKETKQEAASHKLRRQQHHTSSDDDNNDE